MIASYTSKEKNELVKKYEPLINKITKQFHEKVCCDWDTIKSMAYEGFVLAINHYDPEKSSMTFMQYAAYECCNNIKTCLTNESRTVKLPWDEQKKLKAAGKSTFISHSIDVTRDDDGEDKSQTTNKLPTGMITMDKFSDGDVFEYLYSRLEEKFPKDWCEIFYMTYGLKNYEEVKNQDIAKYFNVSDGLISQKRKKMIDFIRQDNDLCEMLSSLLES